MEYAKQEILREYVGKQERDYQRDRSVGNNLGKVRSLKEKSGWNK